ncbi:MAG: hypothetical protein WCH34_16425 [Bacteroidota bacterium]
MAKISSEVKEKIKTLSKEELEKLVIKAATKDKGFYDFLLVNYIDKELGEKDLFQQAIDDLDVLFYKRYKGLSETLQMTNMLVACSKRINEFSDICKNKYLEADLIIYVLEIAFANTKEFGTSFTAFDYKVAMLVKRLITLVTKKMHEDYMLDYKEKINYFLKVLHQNSDHIDSIYAMPKTLE